MPMFGGSSDLFSSMGVSATGMTAEQRRLEASAQNLAVMHVAARPGQETVQLSGVRLRQMGTVHSEDPSFASFMSSRELKGVAVETVTQIAPVRLQYEPGNPLADANGMVAYPAISFLDEMVAMMQSSRAFEANVTAYTEARNMIQRAMEIGRPA